MERPGVILGSYPTGGGIWEMEEVNGNTSPLIKSNCHHRLGGAGVRWASKGVTYFLPSWVPASLWSSLPANDVNSVSPGQAGIPA